MYGLSDHLKDIPRTRFSAVLHGCSRYSGFNVDRLALPRCTTLAVARFDEERFDHGHARARGEALASGHGAASGVDTSGIGAPTVIADGVQVSARSPALD